MRALGPTLLIFAPCLLMTFAMAALGQEERGRMKVVWCEDYISLRASFLGKSVEYPAGIATHPELFPMPGQAPAIGMTQQWPDFTMIARWSCDSSGWPEEYRDWKLDYALMCTLNADIMAELYPKMISEGRFTAPVQFRQEAMNPRDFSLANALRGQEVKYKVVAKAGPGASDYTIHACARIGLSTDHKTVWFYNYPYSISKHLRTR
jgi:hypothetical protein